MANELPEIQIKVISQTGNCDRNHKVGDTFLCTNFTPGGVCFNAFGAMLPTIRALQMGGVHPWETDPDMTTLCCPDPINQVVFELRRLNPERADPRSRARKSKKG